MSALTQLDSVNLFYSTSVLLCRDINYAPQTVFFSNQLLCFKGQFAKATDINKMSLTWFSDMFLSSSTVRETSLK